MDDKDQFIYNYLGPDSPKFYGKTVTMSVARAPTTSAEGSVLYIYQWGTTKFKSLKFRGYNTVHILCNDAPDLTCCDSLAECFYGVKKIVGDLSEWQVHHVKDMYKMFYNSQFNGDISRWKTDSVQNMSKMFKYSRFNGDLSKWQVHNVTNMSSMFESSWFNNDISEWQVYHVIDMHRMFSWSSFDSDISEWQVHNVKDMGEMFYSSQFNGDISRWQVHNVTDMNNMFASSKFNGDISQWQVHNVTNMNFMFWNSEFNGDISKWQVHNVKYMRSMFQGSQFNGDVSEWIINNNDDLGIPKPFFVYYTLEIITTPIFNISCLICSETAQLLVTKCHHSICLECHQQLTSNRCPLCRANLRIIGRL